MRTHVQGLRQLCDGQTIDLGVEMDIDAESVRSRPDGLDGSVSEANSKMQQDFGGNVCFGQVRRYGWCCFEKWGT